MGKKIMLLLCCLFFMSCATLTQEQKCKRADDKMIEANRSAKTDLNLALKQASSAIELCPTNGGLFAYMATLQARKGLYKESAQSAEEALRLDPSNVNVLGPVSWAYFMAGKYDNAYPLLGRLLYLQPNDTAARQLLAEIYIIKRDFKNAETELLKNIKNAPNYQKSYYSLGKLYMDELLMNDEAYKYLSKFIFLDPEDRLGYLNDAKMRVEKVKSTK